MIMATIDDVSDLSGKLLIAMPGMGDPRFDKSVVFVCAHSDDGALGLIVNKPSRELKFRDLLEQLQIPQARSSPEIKVHFGGPVENGRGFVLHSADYASESSTLVVDARFGMTATIDILQEIAQGLGPRSALLALGYAGWGPGQLESEIQSNGWLICDATPDIVFGEADAGKWSAALASIGVDALALSAAGGHA